MQTNAAYWALTGCMYSFFGINVILFPRFPEILLMGASLSSMLLQVSPTRPKLQGRITANPRFDMKYALKPATSEMCP